jgi:hypothetical protein
MIAFLSNEVSGFTLERCSDYVHWDEFVLNSEQSNIFCTSKFFRVLPARHQLFWLSENGKLRLGVIIHEALKNGAPYSFVYNGIVWDPSVTEMPTHRRVRKQLDLTEGLLLRLLKFTNGIRLSLHHSIIDIRGFQWFHYHEPQLGQFKTQIKYTGLLDLSQFLSVDDLLMGIRQVRRQEYRRANENGFTTVESFDINDLSALHANIFDRQGLKMSQEEEAFSGSLAKRALENGFGRLVYCLSPDGDVAAASLFLYDEKCGYYLVGATHPDFRQDAPGTMALINQITWCLGQGIKQVDFVGVNSPNRGDYKTSFGAEVVPYHEVALNVL